MQLFVLSPIIILLLYHYWRIGLLVIVLTMVGTTTGIRIQAGVNDYHIMYNMDNNMDIVSHLYEKPHYSINTSNWHSIRIHLLQEVLDTENQLTLTLNIFQCVIVIFK